MKNNPWGRDEGMEKIEKGVKAVAKPVKKGAADMFKDALQSLTGSYDDKQAPQAEQATQALKAEETKKIQETRARLAQINREIEEIRKKRDQIQQQEKQKEQKPPSLKLRRAREKESVLAKLIKSRQGSKEAMQRASG